MPAHCICTKSHLGSTCMKSYGKYSPPLKTTCVAPGKLLHSQCLSALSLGDLNWAERGPPSGQELHLMHAGVVALCQKGF